MASAIQDQQLAEARIFTPPSAISETGGSGGSLSGSGAQGYWRKPDGTITFGAYTVNGMRTLTRKKFMPLMDYPQFTNDPDKRRGLDPMHDPYRIILEAGGIKEFTLAQVVELGWHRKPHKTLQAAIDRVVAAGATPADALVMVIPQLRGFERKDVPCILCRGRVFNSEDELASHEVLHKEDVQTRRLSDAISASLSGGQKASTETMAPIIEMLAKAIEGISANQSEMQAAMANTQTLIARMLADREAPAKK